jgi:hypothetical protein
MSSVVARPALLADRHGFGEEMEYKGVEVV